MGQEIERKFLVAGDFMSRVVATQYIVQGYLSSVPERTVRVRIADDRAFLTVKGMPSASGMTRFEWEQEIPAEDAELLMNLCEPGVIRKNRHRVPAGQHVFEVDEFLGENAGLIVAEVELAHESEAFEQPAWLGREVTSDSRYTNAALSKLPYRCW